MDGWWCVSVGGMSKFPFIVFELCPLGCYLYEGDLDALDETFLVLMFLLITI